ncbi:electron transfer flavoprotein beta subunit [Thermodesulfobium acidiphilum]|uniref:Protein FixA n=1 Tax=Thermodesulfobium acidiphilum TaxID=1794699 RepID=A0A2R4VYA9_THEAF|nr:electron transfer flavoprotein subunit beta/FixA family protein [Thermodesulfobium acidiphilum]AWB09482.1 electron transfer flavoprotein beta subunit [Thermodesulfobium acidiphilum]
MHSLVFIKQVPDAAQVRVDYHTGTLIRDGVPAIINPYDAHAIEAAVQIKDRFGGIVSVLSMGPPMAEEALRKALSMGADKAYLLCDKVFAGSDTWATSYALWAGAQEVIQENGPVDIFWAGKQAIDGDTAQTGPGLATRFDIPLVTCAIKIIEVNPEKGYVIAQRQIEGGFETLQVTIPCMITTEKELNTLRFSPLPDLIRAAKLEIRVLNSNNIKIDPTKCGLKSSPTKVKRVFVPPKRERKEIIEASVNDVARALFEKLEPVLKEMGKL